jgi:hypothetical protein
MVNLIAADDLHAKWMKAPGYAKARQQRGSQLDCIANPRG